MSDFEVHPTGTGEELKRLREFVGYIEALFGECACYDYPVGVDCSSCRMRVQIKKARGEE